MKAPQLKSPLRILAVDDHHFFLKGIAECLGSLPFEKYIDTCSSYHHMQGKLQSNIPDIIFLDLNMPGQDGFNTCREITARHKNVFVAMLTQYDSERHIQRAEQSGAGAYFIKNTQPDVLTDFLVRFNEGKINDFFVHAPYPGQNDAFEKEDALLIESLSPRETQVLKLLVAGLDLDQIEQKLAISYETLKSHRTNILKKLGLKNIASLVKFAIRNHLI